MYMHINMLTCTFFFYQLKVSAGFKLKDLLHSLLLRRNMRNVVFLLYKLEEMRRKAILSVINTTYALIPEYHPAVRATFQEGHNCLQAQ